MAHYAFLDKDNIVTEVIVGVDENELIEGLTPEQWYSNFRGQKCVRTSYNGNIRKNYAGIGYTYDVDWDAFRAPQPFPSWILNYDTFKWEAPVKYPDIPEEDKGKYFYRWSEINKEWIKILIEQ
jgi:hypothetical protein